MTDSERQMPDPEKAPDLTESLRQVATAGREAFGASKDTGRALRRLVSADLALARSALGRGLAWTGVAVVFGASSWLLLTGALIALLQRFGWSWLQSLSLAAFVSVAVTGLAIWRVMYFFDNAGLHATRRQLTRLGWFDEPGKDAAEEDDIPAPSIPEPPR